MTRTRIGNPSVQWQWWHSERCNTSHHCNVRSMQHYIVLWFSSMLNQFYYDLFNFSKCCLKTCFIQFCCKISKMKLSTYSLYYFFSLSLHLSIDWFPKNCIFSFPIWNTLHINLCWIQQNFNWMLLLLCK